MMTSNVHRVIHDARTYTDNVSAKGELVTSDVIGPFPPTPEGHRYAVSYTDEFSRHSVVYFLKKKSEVPDTIHAVVRYYKLMGIIIKKIRSDRGGEYGGHLEREHIGGGAGHIQPGTAFAEVCKTYEIIHEPMPAHTHQDFQDSRLTNNMHILWKF